MIEKTFFGIFMTVCLCCCLPNEKEISIINDIEFTNCIEWSTKITSRREGEFIFPSYEVTLTKKMPNIITEFEFAIRYYYGQEFNFLDEAQFHWFKNSNEMFELNTNGFIVIKKELTKMEREALTEKSDVFTYTTPDGEDIQGINKKIKYKTRAQK